MKNLVQSFSNFFIILSVALLCFIFICNKSKKSKSPVIARVGRAVLSLDDLNRRIPEEYTKSITYEQRINYVKQWIDTELLYQAALKQKIDKEDEIKRRLNQMKKDLLGAELISRNSIGTSKQKIPEEAIVNYYEKFKDSFIRESDVVKYIEIIVKDLKTGWSVRNMVSSDNFLDLASQYSIVPVQDPDSAQFIPLKNLPSELSDVIFNIRIDGTTSPIKMPDGVHIIRVLDKRNAKETCLLEEVKDDIISTLSTQAQRKDIEHLLSNLRDKSDYEFHFDLITKGKKRSSSSDTSDINTSKSAVTETIKDTSEI